MLLWVWTTIGRTTLNITSKLRKDMIFYSDSKALYTLARIMRFSVSTLTVVIAALSLCFSNPGSAQEVLDRRATIEFSAETRAAILKELSRQTKVRIVYSLSDAIQERISVKASDQSLKQILEQVIGKDDLAFEVVRDRIVITQTATSLQQRVSGKVVGAAGEPLRGITVRVKGTDRVVATDENGVFSITAAPTD